MTPKCHQKQQKHDTEKHIDTNNGKSPNTGSKRSPKGTILDTFWNKNPSGTPKAYFHIILLKQIQNHGLGRPRGTRLDPKAFLGGAFSHVEKSIENTCPKPPKSDQKGSHKDTKNNQKDDQKPTKKKQRKRKEQQ
jgi:hypothetical protein